jgi:TorA maturation chaperone TorD
MTVETNRESKIDRENNILEAIASTAQILGALFLQDPRKEESWVLLDELGQQPGLEEWPFGSDEERGEAAALIAEGLGDERKVLAREYQRLFIGPHHFEAPSWGSVYLDKDQVLFGCSTLELRQWMRANGITINEDKREPEDHIGKMLLLLGWLAREKPELIREFLAEHLMPWTPRYLDLLRADARQPFYTGLAALTQVTLRGVVEVLDVQVKSKRLFR